MAGDHSFYGGTNYGLKQDFADPEGAPTLGRYVPVPAGSISLATDARTANQIKAVTEKLNTGAKAVEVQLTMPDVADSIPDQHLTELSRLRKITGVDLTLHGPLVEPTGIGRDRWDEAQRVQAERQITQALHRAHRVKPDGNIVVTFHSSNGLPDPETKMLKMDKHGVPIRDKDGNATEYTTGLAVIDERTGTFGPLPKTKKDYLEGSDSLDPKDELKRLNEENWRSALSNVTIELNRGQNEFLRGANFLDEDTGKRINIDPFQLYNAYQKDKDFLSNQDEEIKRNAERIVTRVDEGKVFIKGAYTTFKELYNKAYDVAERNTHSVNKEEAAKAKQDIDNLNKLAKEIRPLATEFNNDPTKLSSMSQSLTKGIRLLNEITPPETYKPIKDFAIDKASDTFANAAFSAYNAYGSDSAPIISIENPPVGMGVSRAEELREMIEASQKKFAHKLVEEKGLSEKKAKEESEKLIGATWDVGHINMLRKYGYEDKELQQQTETIAKHVKNIHLSDNFGMEHTELPMGMGNVPMKGHLQELQKQFKDKLKDIKQVIETGNWYQHFQTTPFAETLAAFGSPVYGMQMSPYWNQARQNMGGYFAGYGMNPDIHHSIYGAGFSTLPTELGGQVQGRNRLSGSPVE